MNKIQDKPRNNEALVAAALQDHMLRSLGLSSAPAFRSSTKPKSNKTAGLLLPSGKKPTAVVAASAQPRLAPAQNVASGSLPSSNSAQAQTSNSRVVPKAVSTKEKAKEKEYLLDPRPAPLTLAQRFGLVEKPKERLTEADWQKVKELSNKRADSTQPCVVCKEDFALQPQLLLSCSHVFHRACLEAFERFSGKRCCPLCRRDEYEKRVIYEGARNYRQRAATTIQSTWRGYRVRKAYRAFRESHPPNDPNLRRKFYESKLSSLTDQLVRNCEEDERHTEQLVAQTDANLAQFKRVMMLLDKDATGAGAPQDRVDWTAVEQRAAVRNDEQCPICLTKMAVQSYFDLPVLLPSKQVQPVPGPLNKPPQRRTEAAAKNSKLQEAKQSAVNLKALRKPLAVLSCSHVFHRDCIDMFEELTVMETMHNADRTHIRQCPVCRSPYCRQVCREITQQRR